MCAWRYDDFTGTWRDDSPTYTQLRAEFGYPVTPPPAEPPSTGVHAASALDDTQPWRPEILGWRGRPPNEPQVEGWTYQGTTADGAEIWLAPEGTPPPTFGWFTPPSTDDAGRPSDAC